MYWIKFVLFLGLFSSVTCKQCEVDEIWQDEMPDLEGSVAKQGVTAAELERIHVTGIDPGFSETLFDPDVAFYDCLEKCCGKDNCNMCSVLTNADAAQNETANNCILYRCEPIEKCKTKKKIGYMTGGIVRLPESTTQIPGAVTSAAPAQEGSPTAKNASNATNTPDIEIVTIKPPAELTPAPEVATLQPAAQGADAATTTQPAAQGTEVNATTTATTAAANATTTVVPSDSGPASNSTQALTSPAQNASEQVTKQNTTTATTATTEIPSQQNATTVQPLNASATEGQKSPTTIATLATTAAGTSQNTTSTSSQNVSTTVASAQGTTTQIPINSEINGTTSLNSTTPATLTTSNPGRSDNNATAATTIDGNNETATGTPLPTTQNVANGSSSQTTPQPATTSQSLSPNTNSSSNSSTPAPAIDSQADGFLNSTGQPEKIETQGNMTSPSETSTGMRAQMAPALIAALTFGVVFMVAVVVLLAKRIYDGWIRRHYQKIDYLVNGMYN